MGAILAKMAMLKAVSRSWWAIKHVFLYKGDLSKIVHFDFRKIRSHGNKTFSSIDMFNFCMVAILTNSFIRGRNLVVCNDAFFEATPTPIASGLEALLQMYHFADVL